MTPRQPYASDGDPVAILNWRRFSTQLTTSGQPTESQLEGLARLQVSHVVNLGPHSHEKALANEQEVLAALGIAYTNIPVDFTAPSEVDYQRFCTAMAAYAGDTVHVHCIYNARVTAFICRMTRGRPEAAHAAAMMESVWRPGGVWARFVGKPAEAMLPDRYAGRDY